MATWVAARLRPAVHLATLPVIARGVALLASAPVLLFPHRFATAWHAFAFLLVLSILFFPPSCLRWRRALAPIGVPALLVLLAAAVGSAISIEWPLARPKLFGIVFGLATFYASVITVWTVGRSALHLGWALLVVQGIGIAGVGLVAMQWTTDRSPALQAIYARLPRLITSVQTSSGVAAGIHPAEVGGMLTLLAPIALAPVLWLGSGRAPWLPAAGAVTALPMLGVAALTGSRSTYLGLIAGSITLLLLRARRPAIATLAIAACALALTLAAIASAPSHWMATLFPQEVARDAGLSWGARLEVWQRAVYMMQAFPFSGAGLNQFPLVLDHMYPLTDAVTSGRVPHAHNLLLQTGIDLGLPGLMAFLWIAILSVRCWGISWCRLQSRQSESLTANAFRLPGVRRSFDTAVLAGLLAGLAGHAVFGVTDAVSLGAKPGYLLWMALGVMTGSASLYAPAQSAQPSTVIESTTIKTVLPR